MIATDKRAAMAGYYVANYEPYNPLDKRNLGASVAEALLESDAQPLGSISAFVGAGIYGLYYLGAFPCYQRLAARNRDGGFAAPIYIGKAVPAGARKGGFGLDAPPGTTLFNRLSEHADSISVAENLDIQDFFCRLLLVDDIWIPLGESLLISKFAPVWNTQIDGFGNHDPGNGRYNGMRPRWDVLHPGRGWAAKCQQRPETPTEIAAIVERYLQIMPAPDEPHLLTGG
jgi:hypothetical protein